MFCMRDAETSLCSNSVFLKYDIHYPNLAQFMPIQHVFMLNQDGKNVQTKE